MDDKKMKMTLERFCEIEIEVKGIIGNSFCKAIEKILELNTNEDIDYALCDLVVILSSTFYMEDKTKSNGKKFVTEVIKKSPIMNYTWFWVGLCKFELNQELNSQKSEEETLLEEKGDTPTDTQDKSIFAKLMSITFNILQFVLFLLLTL